jgi:uncharacterized membrane protein
MILLLLILLFTLARYQMIVVVIPTMISIVHGVSSEGV